MLFFLKSVFLGYSSFSVSSCGYHALLLPLGSEDSPGAMGKAMGKGVPYERRVEKR